MTTLDPSATLTIPAEQASTAEDLGLLHLSRGDQKRAINQLKEALASYRLVGAERDQARIRRRLRKLASAVDIGPRPPPGLSPGGTA